MKFPSNIISGTLAELPDNTGIPIALIGLGSNLGSASGAPSEQLRRAMVALTALSDFPVIVSSLWRTAPVDCPPGSPDFVNAAAAMVPRLPEPPKLLPEELLIQLQYIENTFGRVRGDIQNAPRVLDLDLLAWGGLEWDSPLLHLPHPRLHQRAFVLAPLAEIAPEYVIPGLEKSIAELWKSLQVATPSSRDIERI